MNEPKYKTGDRFTVASVEYEIIGVVSDPKPMYLFQNCEINILKSLLTEEELDAVMNEKSA